MRLALAQINPTVGDLAGNTALMTDQLAQARAGGAEMVVFPELCLCGYPPKDLLLYENFLDQAEAAADEFGLAHSQGLTLIFGVPLRVAKVGDNHRRGAGITNSLLAYRDGERLARYDKRLLPTYDVFDEDRYFTPGDRAVIVEAAGLRLGLAICEDLWKGLDAGFASRYADSDDPVAELVGAGAQAIIVPSASPFVLGKLQRHHGILREHAVAHAVYVASVNQVGGNDDLVFDGHAAVYDPSGRLIAAAPGFREHLLIVDLPTLDGTKSRARSGASHQRTDIPTLPASPPTTDPLLSAPPERHLFDALVLGVRDYCRKTGFSSALLGLSGGIDSALTAVIAAAALGAPNVFGVAMPGPYSSEHARSDAHALAERLGLRLLTIPIGAPFDAFRSPLDDAFASLGLPLLGATIPDLTEENLQSRLRGLTLMALSNRSGAILLTTGNKSELAVGYCTLYGDMNGGLAVLSDVTKGLVYRLSRWINTNHDQCGFSSPPIPEGSLTKPPSAELRPDQTDQDSLPPYDQLDQIIERYVEGRQPPETIVRETGIDAATVDRMIRLIDLSEYKRKQAAVGLKVTSVAFGPGRRMPIAQRWRPGHRAR